MKKLLKLLAIGLGVVVLLAATGYVLAVMVTKGREKKKWPVATLTITVPTDSASISHGHHLATAIGKCVDCHGEDLGGRLFIDGMPMGKFAAPNISPGGEIAGWNDADVARAIHHAVNPAGRGLVFMPADAFVAFSAEDLGALIAYVRQVPRVTRTPEVTQIGPVGRLLWATGKMELQAARVIDLNAPIATAPAAGPTPEYGRYLARTGGCTSCHGPGLKGGLQFGPPGTPPSQDLTALHDWQEADFVKALRTGTRPDGSSINTFMPWQLAGLMTDEEMAAVWSYIRTLQK